MTLRELRIPIKLYTAARASELAFNLLHAKDLSRIEEKIYCPVDDAIIDRDELVRGFQVEKGKYVTFADDELANLTNELIEIVAFMPAESVDAVYLDASYHVGCELTSADAYRTLAMAMGEREAVALATFTLHGKEHLAMIRAIETPIADGEILTRLMLHTLFFAGDVTPADGLDEAARGTAARDAVDLTEQLISEMQCEFDPSKYSDHYRERVIAAAHKKLDTAGAKKSGARSARRVDLGEQLRASLATHKKPSRKRPSGSRKIARGAKRSMSLATTKDGG